MNDCFWRRGRNWTAFLGQVASLHDASSAVPLLGRVPGLGRLFRSKAQSSTKSELVILLRAMVVNGHEQNEALSQSINHVKLLKQLLKKRS